MREIMKYFGANRKIIRRVAHRHHARWFDGPTFAETFQDQLYEVMEPVMEAMTKTTRHCHVDILRNYDEMMKALKRNVEENSMFYAIGIREGGTDRAEFIETYIKSEEIDVSRRYSDIFWFYALIDVDTVSGEPIRFIDVYHLRLK
jgi:hypothetical protein